MAAPLAGTRVIELGTMITAPLAGMMLGDLGADVIKVERPGSGDPFRSFEGGSYSPHFVAFNRNKQSLVLDLQAEHDREKLFSLVRTSDVVIDNFRAGVLDRLGLSPERMREINSRIIQCSITGFGTVGPYKDRPAFDTVGQALSGIASLAIDPGAPKFTGTTISDNVTGMYACYAILAALIEREKTGRGRRVEVNMMEASVAFMPDAFVNLETHGIRNGPLTRVSFSQSYVVRCKDGKLLAIHLSSADKFWAALLRVVDDTRLADERFATRDDRIRQYELLVDLLQQSFERRDRGAWMQRLEAEDVAFAPVQQTDEVMADPQLHALGTFRRLELATGGSIRAIQAPVRFDGERLSAWRSPPLLDQHPDLPDRDPSVANTSAGR